MKTFRKFFWFVPTVVWMIVIFQFSAQEAEVSASMSMQVTEQIVEIVQDTVAPQKSYYDLVELIHPMVRKGAHMAEYAILYVLLFLSFFFSMLATRSMAVSILISFAYACIDEYHQTHVLGRSGQYLDVCVDMTGVLIAVAIVLFVYSLWQGRYYRKEEEKIEGLKQEAKIERERLSQ